MQTDVIDILLYIFDHCINDKTGEPLPPHAICRNLEEVGFSPDEIEYALEWLESLLAQRDKQLCITEPSDKAIRIFTPDEKAALDDKSRDYLAQLEDSGLLDWQTREAILDRAVALAADGDGMGYERFKWVVVLVLHLFDDEDSAYAWAAHHAMSGSAEALQH